MDTATGSRGTRIVGIATLVSAAATAAYAFAITGPDVKLGETVRILYVHVPTIVMAYLFMTVNLVASIVYLRRKTAFPDLLAAAAGEIGTVLLGLGLVSGMLWGRPTWGAYWSWGDPRITSTLLLFLMYLGYVTVRNIPAPIEVRNARSAVVGIISTLLIYPVHMSTTWWASLHQGETIGIPGDSKIKGDQEFALYLGFLTFLLGGIWLLMHRFRVGWLADRAGEAEYQEALVERRAEATL